MLGVVATTSKFGVAVPLTDVFGGLSLSPVSPMAARLTDCDGFDFDEGTMTDSDAFGAFTFDTALSLVSPKADPCVVFAVLLVIAPELRQKEQTLGHAA